MSIWSLLFRFAFSIPSHTFMQHIPEFNELVWEFGKPGTKSSIRGWTCHASENAMQRIYIGSSWCERGIDRDTQGSAKILTRNSHGKLAHHVESCVELIAAG